MKICLIADTHFGARGDNQYFLDHQEMFFKKIFFPVLKIEDVYTIVHLGDLVDRRKYINFQTLSRMKSIFFEPIVEQKLDCFIIAGNHDCSFKNSNSLNALDELIKDKANTITEPSEWNYEIGKKTILMIPWINSENRIKTEKMIKNSKSKFCFGHLELRGFEMNPGSVAEQGDDPLMFSKFERVFSGHYHTKSKKNNIEYLGSSFQFTWADENDIRGFHIFDTETQELKFFENPYKMFNRVIYDNGCSEENLNQYIDNTYVKIIVNDKKSQINFENFMKKINEYKPIDVKIVEHKELTIDEENFSGTESTPEIIKKYVEQIDMNCDKNKLETILLKFYNEALLMET